MADSCDSAAIVQIHEIRFSNKIIKHTNIDFVYGIFRVYFFCEYGDCCFNTIVFLITTFSTNG